MTPPELVGEVALVTGGGRGVGRLISLALARAGARVAVVSRSQDELDETVAEGAASGCELFAAPLDVTDETRGHVVVREVEEQLGPVTVLVNNAGTCLAVGPLWEQSPSEWWRDIETSLLGTFLLCRAVVPAMVARGKGRVLNVASGVAVRASPYQSAYAAAKAGVLSLTEALALEAEGRGVAVFAITPGQMPTRMVLSLRDDPPGRTWLPDAVHGQWVPPERLERLVVFLASGRGDVLRGRFLHALDDLEELVRRSDELERGELYVPRLRRL